MNDNTTYYRIRTLSWQDSSVVMDTKEVQSWCWGVLAVPEVLTIKNWIIEDYGYGQK